MSTSDPEAAKALETCENLQLMIDISAKTLLGLRDSLQNNPSSQASQALREAETKLVKMFSRQLISKSKVANIKDFPKLMEFPHAEQWLQVVGLPSSTIKGLLAKDVILDKLLSIAPEQLAEVMKDIGASDSETKTLNRALGKLKAWTEAQRTGISAKDHSQSDLYWTDSTSGSPFTQQRSQKVHLPSRPPSTSSTSRSSTSSTSSTSDRVSDHSSLHSGIHHNNMSSPFYPPRSPGGPPSTPGFKTKSRANTPPPQRRNVINTSAFNFNNLHVHSGSLQKSHSHEFQSHTRIQTTTDTRRSIPSDENESLFSPDQTVSMSKSDTFPKAPPPTPPTLGHRIEHRFYTKTFTFGKCDYCKRKLVTARVCRHCRYKCHKECEKCVAQYSCGLTNELVLAASDMISQRSQHGSPIVGYRPVRSEGSMQDSSSAASSCSSSSPSSPHMYNGPYGSYSPASIQHFTFPKADSMPRFERLHSAQTDSKSRLTSTVGSEDTVISSRGTVEFNQDCITSNDSDQTVIDSNSSEKTLPDHLDGGIDLDNLHSPMLRQPSLSKALEEWDIPYAELVVEDKLGTGRIGTVYKGQWHGPVAIKRIPINPALDLDSQLLAFKQEIAMLKKTRHDNIVLFMGACMKPPELAIVTSFVNGPTLFKETRSNRWNINKITSLASQAVQGMGYLHSKDIIHKQLTSKNVFVERGEKVVITDFGLSNISRLSSLDDTLVREETLLIPQGWLSYLAPEIIRKLKPCKKHQLLPLPFSKSSDVFAFGTIWYELLYGDWPFSKLDPEVIIWQSGQGMKQSLHNIQASKEVKELLMHCWKFTAEERPPFSEISHMLERLPKKRLARSPSHPIQLSRSIDSFFRTNE